METPRTNTDFDFAGKLDEIRRLVSEKVAESQRRIAEAKARVSQQTVVATPVAPTLAKTPDSPAVAPRVSVSEPAETGGKVIRLPIPHPGQRSVIASEARWLFLAAGRRWGKTLCLATIAIKSAAFDGLIVLWTSPTHDQSSIGFKEVQKSVAPSGLANFHLTKSEITFKNGGRIIFRSLDEPESVRGHAADLVLMDEAARCSSDAWFGLLRPIVALAPHGRGRAVLASTPKGRNWWQKEFNRSKEMQQKGDTDYAVFQIPSCACAIVNGQLVETDEQWSNPRFMFKEAKQMYDTMPESTFREEVLAEFTETSSSIVFRNIDDCVDPTLIKHEVGAPGFTYVIAFDPARHGDFSVVIVVCVETREVMLVERWSETSYEIQISRLKSILERFGNSYIVLELNGPGVVIADRLTSEGIFVQGFQTTAASKAQAVEKLALAFETKNISIPNAEAYHEAAVLLDELKSFQSSRSQSGGTKYSAPSGSHDDCVSALWLAFSELPESFRGVSMKRDATMPFPICHTDDSLDNYTDEAEEELDSPGNEPGFEESGW